MLLLEGGGGIGKTELLLAARGEARARAMAVAAARGTELEREFAFGVVRQLLDPIVFAGPREQLFKGAAALATSVFEFGTSGDDERPFAVLHGLHWLCVNAAERVPLALVVDDAHWADAVSLEFLTYLARREHELPVALMVATRPDAELPISRSCVRSPRRASCGWRTCARRWRPRRARAWLLWPVRDRHARRSAGRACSPGRGRARARADRAARTPDRGDVRRRAASTRTAAPDAGPLPGRRPSPISSRPAGTCCRHRLRHRVGGLWRAGAAVAQLALGDEAEASSTSTASRKSATSPAARPERVPQVLARLGAPAAATQARRAEPPRQRPRAPLRRRSQLLGSMTVRAVRSATPSAPRPRAGRQQLHPDALGRRRARWRISGRHETGALGARGVEGLRIAADDPRTDDSRARAPSALPTLSPRRRSSSRQRIHRRESR